MSLKDKSRLLIPLCHMILLPIVKLVLKINILKMEQTFHGRYREGDNLFYVSPTNPREVWSQQLANGKLRMIGLRNS
jgi:hypothetical protein